MLPARGSDSGSQTPLPRGLSRGLTFYKRTGAPTPTDPVRIFGTKTGPDRAAGLQSGCWGPLCGRELARCFLRLGLPPAVGQLVGAAPGTLGQSCFLRADGAGSRRLREEGRPGARLPLSGKTSGRRIPGLRAVTWARLRQLPSLSVCLQGTLSGASRRRASGHVGARPRRSRRDPHLGWTQRGWGLPPCLEVTPPWNRGLHSGISQL